jgi:hypothetical protein
VQSITFVCFRMGLTEGGGVCVHSQPTGNELLQGNCDIVTTLINKQTPAAYAESACSFDLDQAHIIDHVGMYGLSPRKPCQETTWPGRRQHSSGAGCVVCQHNKRSLVSPQIRFSVPEDFLLEGSSDRPGIKAPRGTARFSCRPFLPRLYCVWYTYLPQHLPRRLPRLFHSSFPSGESGRAGGRRARLLETRGEHLQEEPPLLAGRHFQGSLKPTSLSPDIRTPRACQVHPSTGVISTRGFRLSARGPPAPRGTCARGRGRGAVPAPAEA